MRSLACLVVFSILAWAAGCAQRPGLTWQAWSRGQGGTVEAGEQPQRLRTVARRLHVTELPTPLSFRVLATNEPGAYAWPDGSIFVTRGLMRILNEDELGAAIAHEIGHVLAEDPHVAARALGGPAQDAEMRADAIACDILNASGMSPELMIDVLRKMRRDGEQDAQTRDALARRMACLACRMAQRPSAKR